MLAVVGGAQVVGGLGLRTGEVKEFEGLGDGEDLVGDVVVG